MNRPDQWRADNEQAIIRDLRADIEELRVEKDTVCAENDELRAENEKLRNELALRGDDYKSDSNRARVAKILARFDEQVYGSPEFRALNAKTAEMIQSAFPRQPQVVAPDPVDTSVRRVEMDDDDAER